MWPRRVFQNFGFGVDKSDSEYCDSSKPPIAINQCFLLSSPPPPRTKRGLLDTGSNAGSFCPTTYITI